MADVTAQLIKNQITLSFPLGTYASTILAIGAIDASSRFISSILFSGEAPTKLGETAKAARGSWIECWYHDNTRNRRATLQMSFDRRIADEVAVVAYNFGSRGNNANPTVNEGRITVGTNEGMLNLEWVNLDRFSFPGTDLDPISSAFTLAIGRTREAIVGYID